MCECLAKWQNRSEKYSLSSFGCWAVCTTRPQFRSSALRPLPQNKRWLRRGTMQQGTNTLTHTSGVRTRAALIRLESGVSSCSASAKPQYNMPYEAHIVAASENKECDAHEKAPPAYGVRWRKMGRKATCVEMGGFWSFRNEQKTEII